MGAPLFLPTETEASALAFAAGIETGRIPCLREYLDEDLARQNFSTYPRGISKLFGIFRVEHGVATRVAGDAGRAAPVPPAQPSCGSGKPFTNAEGAPRVRASALTDDRRSSCGARSLGAEHEDASHAA
jgi:hypothetical protein